MSSVGGSNSGGVGGVNRARPFAMWAGPHTHSSSPLTWSTYILTLLSSWKVMLPIVLLLWFAFFALAFGGDNRIHPEVRYATTANSNSLRGSALDHYRTADQLQQHTHLPLNKGQRSRISNTDRNNFVKEQRRRSSLHFSHLIVVAGHAVMRLSQMKDADVADDSWYLLDYQRGQDYPLIIKSHIQTGLQLASQDASSIVLFSGGQTRRDVGPLSEAASYYYLAKDKNWIVSDLIERVQLEEYARDSFENLLFSICRFHELTGTYPQRITVVGFDFKRKRFTDLHRQAIQFPSANFSYVGVASPTDRFDQHKAEIGEEEVLNEFRKDLYGCNDEHLAHKRVARNPFSRTIPYELSCPSMQSLLDWCGPQLIDSHAIPWG